MIVIKKAAKGEKIFLNSSNEIKYKNLKYLQLCLMNVKLFTSVWRICQRRV